MTDPHKNAPPPGGAFFLPLYYLRRFYARRLQGGGGHKPRAGSFDRIRRGRTRKGHAASVTLVPRERLRSRPRRPACRSCRLRANLFVCAVRRFAVGDVCERRLWRMKRAKRSGRIKAIGKQALPAQTEPLIQQDEACLHPTAVYRWHSVGRGHAPAGAGTTESVQTRSFPPHRLPRRASALLAMTKQELPLRGRRSEVVRDGSRGLGLYKRREIRYNTSDLRVNAEGKRRKDRSPAADRRKGVLRK